MEASLIAVSMRTLGITQTGHPGPWIKLISFGKIEGRAYFIILCVCPPQISMILIGFLSSCSISFFKAKMLSLSLNSSMKFI